MPFECSQCHQQVEEGNVMVDTNDFISNSKVDWLLVVCKPCTRQMRVQGTGRDYHNMWELRWVRESTIRLFASVITGLTTGEPKKWSKQAADDFFKLAASAHPELMKDPIGI